MAAEGPPLKKAKKEEVSDNDDGKEFDADTQKALEEIDSCQNDLDALNDKAGEEILKVEQKYNKLRTPLYEKRDEIISRIPDFWMTAFVNHPQVSAILQEEEEECMNFLSKVVVEEDEDIKSGYKIIFHFQKNPFFTNDVLVKKFYLGPSAHKSTSTKVNWNEGKDITKKIRARLQSAKRDKKLQMESRSFFLWLADNEEPSQDEIAEVIKDDIWPNPLQYFLVPDAEMENGADEDLLELEDEDVDGEEDEGDELVEEEEDAGAD